MFNLSRVAGPALAGLLIGTVGFAGAYAFDLATFGASLVAIWLLPRLPKIEDAESVSLRSILDGFRLVVREPALLGIFTVDTVAMIFGMPSALFPAFGEALGGGASTVGLLYAAPSAGALRCVGLFGLDDARSQARARRLRRGRGVGGRDRCVRVRDEHSARAPDARVRRRRRLRQRGAALDDPAPGDARLDARTPLGDRARAGRGNAGARQPRGRPARVAGGDPRVRRLGRRSLRASGRRSSRFALPAFRRYEKPA